MDSPPLQYNLPPPQPILFTTPIVISLIVLVIALATVIYLSLRSRARAKKEARLESLRTVTRIVTKRGGTPEDAARMRALFETYRNISPTTIIMLKDRFRDEVSPLLEVTYDKRFAEKMESIFFPPPKDTRRALAVQEKDLSSAVEEQKSGTGVMLSPAIMDLMDAALKPGVVTRLAFEGLEGAFECIVMGHDMQSINVTLPAHSDHLVSSLKQGMRIEGTLESGPSLLAFTSSVMQAVAGSMPYCRIAPWRSGWEVRKRDSVRLPISLDIDFQHISTSATDSINMSSLDKAIGAIRPGKLVDISLGGCAVETPSRAQFSIGDMIRFSKPLVAGNPPATLLGAVVKVDSVESGDGEGVMQRLHVQFLVIDDVSQRILVRVLRQLQDAADREEWIKAQQLMQQMRRNNVENIGSPAGGVSNYAAKRGDTGAGIAQGARPGTGVRPATGVRPGTGVKPGTRSYPKPPTRSIAPVAPRPGEAGAVPGPGRSTGTTRITKRPEESRRMRPPQGQ